MVVGKRMSKTRENGCGVEDEMMSGEDEGGWLRDRG